MMGIANWLAQSGLASRPIVQNPVGGLPRTSYGTPRPVQTPVESMQGPRSGFQRPIPEGYKQAQPRQGQRMYRDPDAGIRGQLGPALEDNGLLQMISPNAYMVQ